MHPHNQTDKTATTARLRAFALAVGWILLLAGCGQRVQFDVSPASFPECEGPNIVAHVTWDASAVTQDPIRIYVYKIGNSKVLWYQGAPKGERDTGKWIADGSTLRLETTGGKLLGERTVETTLCDKSRH